MMARRLPRIALLAIVVAGAGPLPLAAQGTDSLTVRPIPIVVKYGKWLALGTAIGLGILAGQSHNDAEAEYSSLESYCGEDHTRCNTGPGGAYLDPVSENYYQNALEYDRKARWRLVGGEAAFLGAVGLFVWEFTRPSRTPANVPFEPELRVGAGGTMMGVKISF